ncbi:MAG: DUF6537 domain-containing protein [Sphingomonas sp.]
MDYQDAAYAELYLDRLDAVAALDRPPFELTREAARHLALWMSYEDTIRVADLKTRASRIERVRGEVRIADGQLLHVTEFMHPRLREICEALPAPLGRAIRGSSRLSAFLDRFFRKGRHVRTTGVGWFVLLRIMAGMRRLRPHSLRYGEEQARIERWLDRVRETAAWDLPLATEFVRCQRLIKGYGDTFDRGLRNFDAIMAARPTAAVPPVEFVRRLRELALADEEGGQLAAALAAAG